MEADQSFDEEEEEEEEEEDVRTSKKRPASSPALKSQVCFTPFTILVSNVSKVKWLITHLFTSLQKKMKMDMEEDDEDEDDDDDEWVSSFTQYGNLFAKFKTFKDFDG